jgi:3'(2'), 5'-bisphosphate nucleotidase
MNLSNPLLKQYLSVALVAAKKAGDAILAVYRGELDVSYKEDNTPLTIADQRAHNIILDHLRTESLRHIPLLSEEGTHIPYEERKSWENFWLIDPLDGTKEFVNRRNEFSVNIALIEKNRPVLGVVFAPASDSLYFAAAGFGSYRLENLAIVEEIENHTGKSGQDDALLADLVDSAKKLPAHQLTHSSRDKLTLVGSRSHATEALTAFVDRLKQQFGEVELIPAGSSLKFCRVAEGSAGVYPRFGPTMEWDTGAGHCIVEQSGGAVWRMHEKTPLDYNKEDLHNPGFICIGKHFRDIQFPLLRS